VNSIPESASMRVDLRSASMAEIDRLERSLRIALDQPSHRRTRRRSARYPEAAAGHSEVVEIGNRPAGELAPDARLLR